MDDKDHCARCGEVITDDSEAKIGDDRYCHGDVRPTCYELASWAGFSWMSHIADMSDYWPDLREQ